MEIIHIRVPKEVRQQFKVVAATLGKSMTQLMGELITEYLRKIKGANN